MYFRKSVLIIFAIFTISLCTNSFAQLITKQEEKYEGSFDIGATVSNGNAKEQSIQSNFKFEYHFTKELSDILRARAENKEQNDVRTKEEYFVNNQTRQDISKLNFRFLEVEFVSDRFGGYNYRVSETVGLGRKLLDSKKYKISVQSSAGLRQSKLTDGQKHNRPLVRASSHIELKFNDQVSFDEVFDVSADEDATIIRSDANLKILMSQKLYLKLGILFERTSNVPVGTKNTDITTALKIGYEF